MTNRIDTLFARLAADKRKALMPFLTAGDPDLGATVQALNEFTTRGAHIIEVGIPYSDPIADGPVIAASYHRALEHGIKVAQIFQTVRTLRAERSGAVDQTPIVAMVSYAIIHRHGVESFLEEAATAGFDGLIVPDLPLEEATRVLEVASARNLKLIQLITPATPRERASRIAASTTGFIYYVSVVGITGERTGVPSELADSVAWLRTQTSLPICVGFGVSTPQQAQALAPICDGIIIGSAIVRRMAEAINRPRNEVVHEIGDFLAEIARVLEPAQSEHAPPPR